MLQNEAFQNRFKIIYMSPHVAYYVNFVKLSPYPKDAKWSVLISLLMYFMRG
jgi:hypothetical protein